MELVPFPTQELYSNSAKTILQENPRISLGQKDITENEFLLKNNMSSLEFSSSKNNEEKTGYDEPKNTNKNGPKSKVKKCEVCQEIISGVGAGGFSKHLNYCKLYFKFWAKIPSGFQCLLCLKRLGNTKAWIYQHMKSKHSTPEGLQCQFCSTKYSDQTELLNHVSANHSKEAKTDKGIKRKKKSSSDKKEKNLDNKPKYPAGTELKCDYCQETFKYPLVIKHQKVCKAFYKFMKRTTNGFECQICSIVLGRRWTMHCHLKKKHQSKFLGEKSIKKSNSENQKMGSICNQKTMKCDNCQSMIKTDVLTLHTQVCHNFEKSSGRFKCKICSGLFKLYQIDGHLQGKHKGIFLEAKDTLKSVDVLNQTDQGIKTLVMEEKSNEIQKVNQKEGDSSLEKVLMHKQVKHQLNTDKKFNNSEKEKNDKLDVGSLFNAKNSSKGDCTKNGINKKECEFCHEIILGQGLAIHVNSCKIFFKHMKKSSKGYECKACTFKAESTGKMTARFKLYEHLKKTHKICVESNENMRKCDHCNEMIGINSYNQHLKPCKLYSSFMRKVLNVYECKLCSFKNGNSIARFLMYAHIKKKHSDRKPLEENKAAFESNHISNESEKCLGSEVNPEGNTLQPELSMINSDELKINSQEIKCNESKQICNAEAILEENTSNLNNLQPNTVLQNIDIITNNLSDVQSVTRNQWNSLLVSEKEDVQDKNNDCTECTYCKEMVGKNSWNEHSWLCQEASKYINEQTCMICEIEFQSATEVVQHTKKEHLDIIIVMESISEVPKTNVVKEEVIDLDEEQDYATNVFDNKKFKLETKNVKSEVKEEIINLDDLNDDLAENNQKFEPRELTTIFTCPMCFKKYASLIDLETHIALFHRIPKKVQRQSMQGGKSMTIITQIL